MLTDIAHGHERSVPTVPRKTLLVTTGQASRVASPPVLGRKFGWSAARKELGLEEALLANVSSHELCFSIVVTGAAEKKWNGVYKMAFPNGNFWKDRGPKVQVTT